MMASTLSDGPLVSMCCKPDVLYPPGSICYRNGYLPDEEVVFPDIYDSNLSVSTMSPSEFVRSYEFNCNDTAPYLIDVPDDHLFYHLLENGTLRVNLTTRETVIYHLGLQDYCIGSYMYRNRSLGGLFLCETFLQNVMLTAGHVSQYVQVSLSMPFLAATFIVYTILPELRNVHGFNLRAYVGCLFVAYLWSIIGLTNIHIFCIYLYGNFIAFINSLWKVSGLAMYFWILTTFFWLNVMCFDIWWTFRRFRSIQGSSKESHRNKIIIYSLYAWGASALMTVVIAIIDSLSTVPMGVVKPGLNEGHCWFNTPASEAIYLYGPMAITIIVNVCFFASTAITIKQHEKNTANQLNENDERRRKDEKKRFKLYINLFMVMGITWLAELVPKLFTVPKYVTYILDLPNTLQGISIFIIFIWKKKIRMLLLKRLGSLRGR